MRTLTPGQWYLRFTCEHCNEKEILFADLSRGESKIKATYIVECSSFTQAHTTATTSSAISIPRLGHLNRSPLIGPFNYQTQPHDEIKHSDDLRVAPVVMDQATVKPIAPPSAPIANPRGKSSIASRRALRQSMRM